MGYFKSNLPMILISIFNIPARAFFLVIISQTIFNFKTKKLNLLLYYLFMVPAVFLLNYVYYKYHISSVYICITQLVIMSFALFHIIRINYYEAVNSSMIVYLIFSLTDIIIKIITHFIKLGKFGISTEIMMIIYSVLFIAFLSADYSIIKKLIKNYFFVKSSKKARGKIINVYITLFVTIIVILYGFAFNITVNYLSNNLINIFIQLIAVLSIFIVVLMFLILTESVGKERQNNEEIINQYLTIEDLYSRERMVIHNISNNLAAIKGYILNNDVKKTTDYIDDLNNEINELQCFKSKYDLFGIKDAGLKGLFISKQLYAENMNVNLIIRGELSRLPIPEHEFIEIMGVYIDNAIEAASECECKEAMVIINEEENFIQIEIINTCNISENAERIGQKGFTTKKNHTGIGVASAKKLLSKYHNVNMYTHVSKSKYSVSIDFDLNTER